MGRCLLDNAEKRAIVMSSPKRRTRSSGPARDLKTKAGQ